LPTTLSTYPGRSEKRSAAHRKQALPEPSDFVPLIPAAVNGAARRLPQWLRKKKRAGAMQL
jgi:hypothetical protein